MGIESIILKPRRSAEFCIDGFANFCNLKNSVVSSWNVFLSVKGVVEKMGSTSSTESNFFPQPTIIKMKKKMVILIKFIRLFK
jgi:hypothetical protein